MWASPLPEWELPRQRGRCTPEVLIQLLHCVGSPLLERPPMNVRGGGGLLGNWVSLLAGDVGTMAA